MSRRSEGLALCEQVRANMSPAEAARVRGELMNHIRDNALLDVMAGNVAVDGMEPVVISFSDRRNKRAERFARRGAA